MNMLKETVLIVFVAVSAVFGAEVLAQENVDELLPDDKTTTSWTDSLEALNTRFLTWKYEGADTLSNPYYAPLFTAHAFPSGGGWGILTLRDGGSSGEAPLSAGTLRLWEEISMALGYIYGEKPVLVSIVDKENMGSSVVPAGNATATETYLPKDNNTVIKKESVRTELFEPEIDIEVEKPDFWALKANFSFQLMQNYVTDNWYKGGESNHALLGQFIAEANYDNKRQIKFNNKLEMRLGFQSSTSDEIHKYKTNNDLIRLTNEFRIKAFKHWDYSAMLQSWTQFYRGYKKNDPRIYSDFMSPFESLLTLGMKYSLNKKNFELSVNISPLALDFKYVGRHDLITLMGLKEGKHSKFEYGSNITATHKWTIFKNIIWTGRFYYYTSYKRTQIEWENTLNLKVNKYLSTQLFLYPRFDDGVKRRDENSSYFQFKEYLSIGLDVSF